MNNQHDVISFKLLLEFFWRTKFITISITLCFMIASVFWVLQLPNQYTAEVTLTSNDNQSNSGLSGLAGQFGGLASLAGMNLNNTNSNSIDVALEVLESKDFIFKFIVKHNLLPHLLASKKLESNQVIFTSDYDAKNNTWKRTPPSGKGSIPTPWEGYDKFIKRLNIEKDPKTGIIKVSFEYISPQVSLDVINSLIEELNFKMRADAINEAKASISYLSTQANKTNVTELKKVFYSLIEEQTKQLMLAEVSSDYTFKIVSPAILPEDKSNPKRAFICVIFSVFGFLFSLLIVFVKESIQKNP